MYPFLYFLSAAIQISMAAIICILALGNFANRFKLGFEMGKPYPDIKPGDEKPKKPKDKFGAFRSNMALIKTAGTGVIAISGKIAGTVFTIGGQQGPFARVWAKPRNRRTALQNLARGVLSGISTSWRALTTAQADAWNAAGSGPGASGYNLRKNVFGDSRHIDGSQLYQRINNILLSVGLPAIASPPSTGATDAILSTTSSAAQTGQSFTSIITTFGGATLTPANTYMKVFMTPQKGKNQSYFGKSDYRLNAVVAPGQSINPTNLATAYIAQFGALVAGSKIGMKVEFVYYSAGVFSKGGAVFETVTVAP